MKKPTLHLKSVVSLLTCCLIVALLLPVAINYSTSHAEEVISNEVVAVFPKSFPPYYMIDDEGYPSGFAIEVIDEIARRAGFQVRFVAVDTWSEATKYLKDGRAHLIPSLGISEKRREFANFTVPMDTYKISLFVRQNETRFKTLSDFAHRAVGVRKDNIGEELIAKLNGADKKIFPNFSEMLEALTNYEIDAFIYPEIVALRSANGNGAGRKIKIVGQALHETPRAIAVAKGLTSLHQVIDRTLVQFEKTHEFEDIYQKWIGSPDGKQKTGDTIWPIFTGGLVVLLTFFYLYQRVWRKSHLRPIMKNGRSTEPTIYERGRFLTLLLVMTIVSTSVMAVTILVLYNASVNEIGKRLVETAKSHARLMESMAQFELKYSSNSPGGSTEATLSQIREGLTPLSGTWEITIARRVDDNIIFSLRQKSNLRYEPAAIPFSSHLAEPMRKALSGLSGTLVGFDYRNRKVFAAYEPIALLNMGIVVKIDMSQIQAPFIRAAWISSIISIAVILLGSYVFLIVSNPIIEKIQKSERRYRRLFDDAAVSIWNEDISAVHKALAALRQNGVDDLRQYIDENKMFVWDMAALVKVLEVNEATLKLFGAETQSDFFNQIGNSFGPKAIETFREELLAIWDKKKIFHTETSFRAFDGPPLDVILSFRIPDAEEGFHSISVSITDITERKAAERELRKLSQAVEQSPASVIITNVAGDIEYVNPKFEQTSGYILAEVVGKNPRILSSGEKSKEEYKNLWSTLESGNEWRGEFHNKRKDGSLYWESVSISQVKNADGETTNYLAIKEDVTAHKELAAQLIQSGKMATLGEMSTGIAHELNQPLNVISMAAQSGEEHLKDGKLDKDFLATKFSRIRSQIDRAGDITDHMRIFGRKASSEAMLYDPCDVIDSACDLIGQQLKLHNIDVIRKYPENHNANVIGFASLLEQVVINILTNAKDAIEGHRENSMTKGHISFEVNSASDDAVEISVTDNGGGIPEKVLDKIFEPFFTTKKIGDGTGLGMSISYGIIKDMNGSITAKNVPGGAQFTIHILKKLA